MIKPVHINSNWDIKDFISLNYEWGTHKDKKVLDEYLKAGHDTKFLSMYYCQQPNPMPSCVVEYIKPHFKFLSNIGLAVHYYKPGQYLPLHVDVFDKYLTIENVKPESIVRYIVMLEDSSPGQIIQLEKNCIGTWRAGDCFSWNYKDLHAFYNFSRKDRYAIQVTGCLE